MYHLDLEECEILEIGVSSDNITYFEISNGENKLIVGSDSKTIYHSKPEIIEAKSMVKKEIQGFIGKSGHVGTTCLFAPSNDYVPCTITFEVEE